MGRKKDSIWFLLSTGDDRKSIPHGVGSGDDDDNNYHHHIDQKRYVK